jgi:hypothetical protein
MRGHGCVVTGKTLRDAVRIAVYLMVNARLQTEAMRFGDVTFLSEEEIAATADMAASPLACDRVLGILGAPQRVCLAGAAKSGS